MTLVSRFRCGLEEWRDYQQGGLDGLSFLLAFQSALGDCGGGQERGRSSHSRTPTDGLTFLAAFCRALDHYSNGFFSIPSGVDGMTFIEAFHYPSSPLVVTSTPKKKSTSLTDGLKLSPIRKEEQILTDYLFTWYGLFY